jgi:hypothetical protein
MTKRQKSQHLALASAFYLTHRCPGTLISASQVRVYYVSYREQLSLKPFPMVWAGIPTGLEYALFSSDFF